MKQYKKQMTDKEARAQVEAAIAPLARSDEVKQQLTEHLFLLQNNYAVELAQALNDQVKEGKPPEFGESKVMQGMFERAMDILIKRKNKWQKQ